MTPGSYSAMAAIGLSLSVHSPKGDKTKTLRQTGIEILRRLPDDRGRELVKLLARISRVEHERARLQSILEAVTES